MLRFPKTFLHVTKLFKTCVCVVLRLSFAENYFYAVYTLLESIDLMLLKLATYAYGG